MERFAQAGSLSYNNIYPQSIWNKTLLITSLESSEWKYIFNDRQTPFPKGHFITKEWPEIQWRTWNEKENTIRSECFNQWDKSSLLINFLSYILKYQLISCFSLNIKAIILLLFYRSFCQNIYTCIGRLDYNSREQGYFLQNFETLVLASLLKFHNLPKKEIHK